MIRLSGVHACWVTSVVSDSVWPYGLQPARLLCPWSSPLQWVAMPSSQGIFSSQGSDPGLLHCRQILYFWVTGKPRCYENKAQKEGSTGREWFTQPWGVREGFDSKWDLLKHEEEVTENGQRIEMCQGLRIIKLDPISGEVGSPEWLDWSWQEIRLEN